jgi:hypothetical protein
MKNRYYDPATGVFVSQDPLINQTNQAYVYSNDNPVGNWDPSGLESQTQNCLGVQEEVVAASNQNFAIDSAAINALSRACPNSPALNQLLIHDNQASASCTYDTNHSFNHLLLKSVNNVVNDVKGFGQGILSVADNKIACTGPRVSCDLGAVDAVGSSIVLSAAAIYYAGAALWEILDAGETTALSASLAARSFWYGVAGLPFDASSCLLNRKLLGCIAFSAGLGSILTVTGAGVEGAAFALNVAVVEPVANIINWVSSW